MNHNETIENKVERIGDMMIAKAHRYYNMMRMNEKCWREAKTKIGKKEFEEGALLFRARWAVCMDIIEELGIEEKYYETCKDEDELNAKH